MKILNEVLLQSSLIFLWGGAFMGILIGAAMLLKPEQVIRLNQRLSRYVSTEKIAEHIDRPRWTERFFYRHHRPVGAAVLIGAILVLYTFLFSFNLRKVSAFIPRGWWWLSDALLGMLLIGSVLAALVGIIVLTRPSLLRDIEKAANRWVSSDRLLSLFNGMHYSAEQSMLRHNRVAGGAIMLGSLYIVVVLGYFLFRGADKIAILYALW